MTCKVLYLDIETAPTKAYVWSLFKTTIAINQIEEPGYTLCWAAKWEGSKEILYSSVNDGEKAMMKGIHKLLDEADVIVHFNGKKFDIPTINREFVRLGFMPPTTYKQVDLYHTVRREFRFQSNKLDFVCQQLGLGSKTQHKGMDLWTGCMNGLKSSWKVMERYNKQDVRLLPKLYKRLLPWIANHPNMALYEDPSTDIPTCRNCGGTHVIKKGIERTNVLTYQRYKCVDCGTNMRGRKRLHVSGTGVLT